VAPVAEADHSRFADLEKHLFGKVGEEFQRNGALDPIDFWAILVWKANRSKHLHLRRFARSGLGATETIGKIASGIHSAESDRERLAVLIGDWGFRLPTASAILSVLYPQRFTVFDARVCGEIEKARRRGVGLPSPKTGEFRNLAQRNWSAQLWTDYEAFKMAAVSLAPAGLSLRKVDQFHWGNSWYESALKDLGITNRRAGEPKAPHP
jgi:hypothetical protein